MGKRSIFLVMVFLVFFSSFISVKAADSVVISTELPTLMKFKDVSTKDKTTYNSQSVVFNFTEFNRNVCARLHRDGEQNAYLAKCGDEGDTEVFNGSLEKLADTYTLEMKTMYFWFDKTAITVTWNYN